MPANANSSKPAPGIMFLVSFILAEAANAVYLLNYFPAGPQEKALSLFAKFFGPVISQIPLVPSVETIFQLVFFGSLLFDAVYFAAGVASYKQASPDLAKV